eukprot:COSAG02_NODE_2152_length_9655_cov_6.433654_1_plen_44_part_00
MAFSVAFLNTAVSCGFHSEAFARHLECRMARVTMGMGMRMMGT